MGSPPTPSANPADDPPAHTVAIQPVAIQPVAIQPVAIQPARGSFAGRLAGSDLTLLVALEATGGAFAYVCAADGGATWFSGTSRDGVLVLGGPGSSLQARVSSRGLTGRLTLAGQTYPVELAPLRRGGLYTSRDRASTWIVLDDGNHAGAAQQGKPVQLDRLSRKWGRLTAAPT